MDLRIDVCEKGIGCLEKTHSLAIRNELDCLFCASCIGDYALDTYLAFW